MKILNIKKEYYIIIGMALFIALPYKTIIVFILDHAMFWLFAGILALIVYAYLGTIKERTEKAKLNEFKFSGNTGYNIADTYKKRFVKNKK